MAASPLPPVLDNENAKIEDARKKEGSCDDDEVFNNSQNDGRLSLAQDESFTEFDLQEAQQRLEPNDVRVFSQIFERLFHEFTNCLILHHGLLVETSQESAQLPIALALHHDISLSLRTLFVAKFAVLDRSYRNLFILVNDASKFYDKLAPLIQNESDLSKNMVRHFHVLKKALWRQFCYEIRRQVPACSFSERHRKSQGENALLQHLFDSFFVDFDPGNDRRLRLGPIREAIYLLTEKRDWSAEAYMYLDRFAAELVEQMHQILEPFFVPEGEVNDLEQLYLETSRDGNPVLYCFDFERQFAFWQPKTVYSPERKLQSISSNFELRKTNDDGDEAIWISDEDAEVEALFLGGIDGDDDDVDENNRPVTGTTVDKELAAVKLEPQVPVEVTGVTEKEVVEKEPVPKLAEKIVKEKVKVFVESKIVEKRRDRSSERSSRNSSRRDRSSSPKSSSSRRRNRSTSRDRRSPSGSRGSSRLSRRRSVSPPSMVSSFDHSFERRTKEKMRSNFYDDRFHPYRKREIPRYQGTNAPEEELNRNFTRFCEQASKREFIPVHFPWEQCRLLPPDVMRLERESRNGPPRFRQTYIDRPNEKERGVLDRIWRHHAPIRLIVADQTFKLAHDYTAEHEWSVKEREYWLQNSQWR